jgi:hypothetical protein
MKQNVCCDHSWKSLSRLPSWDLAQGWKLFTSARQTNACRAWKPWGPVVIRVSERKTIAE